MTRPVTRPAAALRPAPPPRPGAGAAKAGRGGVRSSTGAGSSAGVQYPAGTRYLAESERPWVSLVFVLPIVLVYEAYAAGLLAGPTLRGDGHVTAFVLIDELFALFGATGRHLPAVGLVGMLLCAHLMRRDPWRVRPRTIAGMAIEALFWAGPLVVLGWGLARLLPLGMPGWTSAAVAQVETSHGAMSQRVVLLSLGAGLYEEMLFRLIGVSAFVLILQQGFGLKPRVVYPVVLVGLGLLFSLYHYLGPREVFAWRPFTFRTLAGCYLGLVYVLRGFGITAVSHAAYDVCVGTLAAA
jgi:hypothetical protein